jgi:hypothetical protein
MELIKDERVPFQDRKSMRCEADHSMERAHRVPIIAGRKDASLGMTMRLGAMGLA